MSVILPCYNSERDLPNVLREIEKQTFKDRELLIIDDGSTDKSRDISSEYCASHTSARLIRGEHLGLTHARNVGLRESKGEVIFYAESDCVYDEDYVEKAVNCLDGNPSDSAVCLTGGPLKLKSTLATESIEIENFLQHKLLAEGKIKPFYAWVFRKAALEKLKGFDEGLFQGEDKDIFIRFKQAGYAVAWIPGIHWRHRRDQTTAELATKFFRRGKSRIKYVMKHRLIIDLCKSLVPFWAFVIGIFLLFFYPVVGAGLLAFVLILFLGRAVQVTRAVWGSVKMKRNFLGYPLYLVVRNFSSALGYMYGMLSLATRSEGKPDDRVRETQADSIISP